MDIVMRRAGSKEQPARYYSVAVQYALGLPPQDAGKGGIGAGVHLKREWGRIGDTGRVQFDPHPSVEAAEAAAVRIVARKRGEGFA